MDNVYGIEQESGKTEKKCVYCGKIIIKRSKEHIIQNAIVGLYES